jgi:proteic killer suppression protein
LGVPLIKSFKNHFAEAVFEDRLIKGFPADIFNRARSKMELLNAAGTLNDLRIPPSNRLELLKGNRAGQYSIRINDQWRICFHFIENNAENVEIIDYH